MLDDPPALVKPEYAIAETLGKMIRHASSPVLNSTVYSPCWRLREIRIAGPERADRVWIGEFPPRRAGHVACVLDSAEALIGRFTLRQLVRPRRELAENRHIAANADTEQPTVVPG